MHAIKHRKADGGKVDYAVLSFDYDGERVSFDPAQRVVRQVGDVTEVIARDVAAEAESLPSILVASPTMATA